MECVNSFIFTDARRFSGVRQQREYQPVLCRQAFPKDKERCIVRMIRPNIVGFTIRRRESERRCMQPGRQESRKDIIERPFCFAIYVVAQQFAIHWLCDGRRPAVFDEKDLPFPFGKPPSVLVSAFAGSYPSSFRL